MRSIDAPWKACVVLAVLAQGALPSEPHGIEAAVADKLRASIPHLTVSRIAQSPVPELLEVQVEERGALLYVTVDGTHLVAGDMYAVIDNGLANVSEVSREKGRRHLLATIDPDEFIVFAPDRVPVAVVYVFTDVDCPYCRQFHAEIDAVNVHGIEVRYLAYPTAGAESETGARMAAAWCAEDRGVALTALKRGGAITASACDDPVTEHVQLGERMGVEGTPTLITADGRRLEGHLAPTELARALGLPGTGGD